MMGPALFTLITAPLLAPVMGVDSPLEIIDKTISDNIDRVNTIIQDFKGNILVRKSLHVICKVQEIYSKHSPKAIKDL